ncbi:MAG: XdhC family protein [Gemmatimonas sp.]|uniref:XdhC family protein n=1 Tax=Gemmatimonas sp. TaxID=1962908 RepID=UPI00391F5758
MNGFVELARAAAGARQERPGVPLALATLVRVDGSSYRQPGARLLVDAEGRILAGAISGGCLEGDVATRAAGVCATGRAIRLRYDLRADLETIWGFGAACDGVAHLLLEPLTDWRWMAQAEAIRGRRHGGAVVTMLDADGGGATAALLDGPAQSGRWHLWHESARSVGEAGLHALAATAQHTAQASLHPVPEQAMAFVEPLVAPIALHLVGAGRGAEAFAHFAALLGWHVTVLDHRPALLSALSLPRGVQTRPVRHLDAVPASLAELPHDGRTAVALLSHVYDVDLAWLMRTLTLPLGYIGVLGSRRRAAQLVEAAEAALSALGTPLTARQRHKLHAPIGLDLGGESPASIALSAIAEIEAVMHARPGGFLRERQSPIHTRTPTPQLRERDGAPTPGNGLLGGALDVPPRCDVTDRSAD